MISYRTCQFCKKQDREFSNGVYTLFKYGVRHYAHAACLAKKHGDEAAKAMLPEHERHQFHAALIDAGFFDKPKPACCVRERAAALEEAADTLTQHSILADKAASDGREDAMTRVRCEEGAQVLRDAARVIRDLAKKGTP